MKIKKMLDKKIGKKTMFKILQSGGLVPSLYCEKENLKVTPRTRKEFIALITKNFNEEKGLNLHFGEMI